MILWPLGKVDEAAHLLDSAVSLARQSGHLATVAWANAYACRFAASVADPDRPDRMLRSSSN